MIQGISPLKTVFSFNDMCIADNLGRLSMVLELSKDVGLSEISGILIDHILYRGRFAISSPFIQIWYVPLSFSSSYPSYCSFYDTH